MSIAATTTAEQLLRISSEANAKGQRCELVAGEVRFMSPGGWLHGDVIGRLHAYLGNHVVTNRLGRIFGAETGFVLERNPDTVRAPDLAFVAVENIPAKLPTHGYWPGAPDFVVEVISLNDRAGEIDEKIQAWLTAGVQAWLTAGVKVVWVVDPELQTVTAYRSTTDVAVYTRRDTISSIELLPGFSLPKRIQPYLRKTSSTL